MGGQKLIVTNLHSRSYSLKVGRFFLLHDFIFLVLQAPESLFGLPIFIGDSSRQDLVDIFDCHRVHLFRMLLLFGNFLVSRFGFVPHVAEEVFEGG